MPSIFLKIPVSATHSIVGGTIGYAMVVHGTRAVNWFIFIKILISWIASPILAGTLSVILLLIIRKFLSSCKQPVMILIKWLPFIYAVTVMVNVFSILVNGPDTHLQFWHQILITTFLGVLVSLLVWYFTVPRVTNSIRKIIIPTHHHQHHSSSLYSSEERKKEGYINELVELLDTEQDSVRTKVSRYIEDNQFRDDQSCDDGDADELESRYRSVKTQTFMVPVNTANANCSTVLKMLSCEVERGMATAAAAAATTTTAHITNEEYEFADEYESSISAADKCEPIEGLEKGVKAFVVVLDRPDVSKIFAILQIMSAIFGSFTHGCNDVSNAIAPLVAIWMIWVTEINLMGAKTPLWILMHGGICISLGIWFNGEGTTKTIGEGITNVTPTSGFVMELCSATAVLIASNLGLPVSSTHCKVGSVVCVGSLKGWKAVNWKLVRNIAFAWIVTFPATAITSAAIMTLLLRVIPNLLNEQQPSSSSSSSSPS